MASEDQALVAQRVKDALERGDAPIHPDWLDTHVVVDAQGEKKRVANESIKQHQARAEATAAAHAQRGAYKRSLGFFAEEAAAEERREQAREAARAEAAAAAAAADAANAPTPAAGSAADPQATPEKQGEGEIARDPETGEPQSKRQKKNNKRGQFKNKERRKQEKDGMQGVVKSNTISICPHVALWNKCDKEHCTRRHDVDAKLKQLLEVCRPCAAPADGGKNGEEQPAEAADKAGEEKPQQTAEQRQCLASTVFGAEQCPVFEQNGFCPAGINCAWWRAHVCAETGRNLMRSSGGAAEGGEPKLVPIDLARAQADAAYGAEIAKMRATCSHLQDGFGESGLVYDDVKMDLRKRKYDFALATKACNTSHRLCPGGGRKGDEEAPAKEDAAGGEKEDGGENKKAAEAEQKTNVVIDSHTERHLAKQEKAKTYFKNKRVLAPLTTVGNLPFRRLCVDMGAEVTVGEMALSESILTGSNSECALLRRHASEKQFGVQITGGNQHLMAKATQFIDEHIDCDFIDINAACPLDQLHKKGCGSMLTVRTSELQRMIMSMQSVLELKQSTKLLTAKIRISHYDNETEAKARLHHAKYLIPKMAIWGVNAVVLHGRTARQRYSRLADWSYLAECKTRLAAEFAADSPELARQPSCTDVVRCYDDDSDSAIFAKSLSGRCTPNLIGCGDVMNYGQAQEYVENGFVDSVMVGRGALIKPWIFSEIRDKKSMDISASERFDLIGRFVRYGLEHWGSDERGIASTRRFLLEWLSFYHRYIPSGLLERGYSDKVCINWRPSTYHGRDDLETLLSSGKCSDWVRISEMFLGKVDKGNFSFVPKHKSAAY